MKAILHRALIPAAVIALLWSCTAQSEEKGAEFRFASFDTSKGYDHNIKQLDGVNETSIQIFDKIASGIDPTTNYEVMIGSNGGVVNLLRLRFKQYIGPTDFKSLSILENKFGLNDPNRTINSECSTLKAMKDITCTEILYYCSASNPSPETCAFNVISAASGEYNFTAIEWNRPADNAQHK
ncbi:hypothetical protein [Sinorhizobium meliloti]|uniref:hypothetical protein n=1 Tax=Rhizobium meliloti TaxID=382 RepID=UPI000FD96BB3|nr:hypothetical protein [Sinorhizobium meliloti]RVG96013.1 hypothetical protein CN218_08185 [Sinorhizobium meliloti]WQP07795.1 hypothetical protein U8C39_19415 [Sinorhizobium meliloti]WQP21200.1 hypothetical protein U8C33_19545 [Sinorhizobium meliloti]WQP34615.1 hypothetical protein U8C45_19370 [Sinorhizobium meliloti]